MFTRALGIIAVFMAGFCYTTLPSTQTQAVVDSDAPRIESPDVEAWISATEHRISLLEELAGVSNTKVVKYVRSDTDLTSFKKPSKAKAEVEESEDVVDVATGVLDKAKTAAKSTNRSTADGESDEQYEKELDAVASVIVAEAAVQRARDALKAAGVDSNRVVSNYGSAGTTASSNYGSTGSRAVSGYGSTGYSTTYSAPVTSYYSTTYSGGSTGYSAYRTSAGYGSTGYSATYSAPTTSYAAYKGPVRRVLSRLPILRRFAANRANSATQYSSGYAVMAPQYSTAQYSTGYYGSPCDDPNCVCVDCDCIGGGGGGGVIDDGNIVSPYSSVQRSTARSFRSAPRTFCDKATGQCYQLE